MKAQPKIQLKPDEALTRHLTRHGLSVSRQAKEDLVAHRALLREGSAAVRAEFTEPDLDALLEAVRKHYTGDGNPWAEVRACLADYIAAGSDMPVNIFEIRDRVVLLPSCQALAILDMARAPRKRRGRS